LYVYVSLKYCFDTLDSAGAELDKMILLSLYIVLVVKSRLIDLY
jgi:hypothetical protein